MALTSNRSYIDGTILYQWLLDEPSEQLVEMCAAEGLPTDCIATAESRRREMLGERLLLKHIFGTATPLLHNDDRAPYLADSNIRLSIAHTNGWLGIAINPEHAMGIDVEGYKRRILRIREAFLSEAERSWFGETDELAHMIAWTAKEAIFKTIGERKLVDSYRDEIIVDAFETPHIGDTLHHTGHFKTEDFYLETALTDDRLITFCCASRNIKRG